LEEPTPILDSIDYRFCRAKSFKMLENQLGSKEGYKEFKNAFINAKNNIERKLLLNEPANAEFKVALEKTKYRITRGPIEFKQAKSISK